MNDLEEPLSRLGVFGLVDQRFGVALDRGQRRAQLVRDVGDEIAADLIRLAQVGDVVHHEHRAAAGRHDRRDAGDERARGVARHRQFQASVSCPASARPMCSTMPGWRMAST